MVPSRHNIVSRVKGSSQHFVVNLLSGEADLLDEHEVESIAAGAAQEALVAKGYVVDRDDEERRYRAAYLAFLRGRDSDELQLFYVPTYACNFGCDYCYQQAYAPEARSEQRAVIEAFFAYVDTAFVGRKKYVTIFGGEPLLPSPSARGAIEQLTSETRSRGLDVAVVTNGYHLASYVDLLSSARIREVQVTLDGPEPVHDARRFLKGGGGTFQQVVHGIDACLAARLPVNLRTVLDRQNIGRFVELARFAIARGWTEDPLFKTQLGRNYELHGCQPGRERLYTRLELFQDLYSLARTEPDLLRFHKPAFSVARFLFEQGALPEPLFDACPACKTEWAFDYTGKIFPCTADVGKPGEELGTFYPTVFLDEEKVAMWEERDVLAIPECHGCELSLACGGGCGAVSRNRDGSVLSPDCRPVRELLELGLSLYESP